MRTRRFPRRLRPLEESLLLMALALGSVFFALSAFSDHLYFTMRPSYYGVLHIVMEMTSILVSFSVFIVNWEASKQSRNTQSLFVATGFLAVAAGDLMHTLSYEGMPDFFTANGVEKAIYFWLFARLWSAIILLAAAFVRPESSSPLLARYSLAGFNILACLGVLVAVLLYSPLLPQVYVSGQGLTPLKVGAEYAVIALNLIGVLVYVRRYRKSADFAQVILVAALVVSIFSEIAFTIYQDPYDVYNLVGHVYKVLACYLIFRALLVSSVERPYHQLQHAKESLERTVEQLNRRTRELDALDEVALTLSSSLRPDELLPAAIDKVMAVMRAEAGAIFLTDDQSGQLKLAAWKGLKASAVAQYQAHAVRVPFSASLHAGAPGYAVLDSPGVVRTLGGTVAHIAPLRACVCAPVSTKGRLLGAIAMIAGPDVTFSPTEADLLTAVGYQLGLAVENARLYDRTDEQLREKLLELERAEGKSRFLAEVSALLASSRELTKVLDLVARKATEVVGDWCAIYLLDEREGVLRLETAYHADEDELCAIRRMLGRRPIKLSEGSMGEAARTGEATLVVGERLQRFTSSLQSFVDTVEEVAVIHRVLPSSAAIAPMRARGRTVGVLVVMETHTPELLGEAELALVSELGDRAGVAIENSQLLQESLAQRRHLEAVIFQMVDGVVIADADGQVLVANSAAQGMLRGQFGGLIDDRPPAPVAQDSTTVGTADRLPLIRRALAGESLLGEEILVAGEAGERVLSASATAIRGDQGEVSGAVVVLRDVTAEREIDRMKDEFVATVSHELRTPITAVLGYTDLMLRGLRGPLTGPQTDALNSVRNAGHRLLKLIEDLLDISKLEAGKQELVLEVVSIGVAVSRALTSIAFMANARGIRLVQSIPRELPLVTADEDQLQRILANLLSNAVKFTPEGGTVTVSASSHASSGELGTAEPPGGNQGWIMVTVTDTGPGIPPELQDRIWEKFQQADSSSSRPHGGTGLGLAIVRGLVELHGGRVWVVSPCADGKGSAFNFTLPAVKIEGR